MPVAVCQHAVDQFWRRWPRQSKTANDDWIRYMLRQAMISATPLEPTPKMRRRGRREHRNARYFRSGDIVLVCRGRTLVTLLHYRSYQFA